MTAHEPVHSEFQQILHRICEGSDDAVWEFIESYGPHIQRVIRRRLHPQLRTRFDSVDFMQMVWASFFAQPEAIRRFRDRDDLIRYLMTVARNKVVDESRRRHNAMRNLPPEDETPQRADATRAPQPTPSQIAMARERWESMMNGHTERNRRIVQLRMSGATYLEIGQTLGIHERTARQVIADLAGAASR